MSYSDRTYNQITYLIDEEIRRVTPLIIFIPDDLYKDYVFRVNEKFRYCTPGLGVPNILFRGKVLIPESCRDELQGQDVPGQDERSDVEALGEEVRITLPSSVRSLRIGFG